MAGREGPYRRDFNSTNYIHPKDENLSNLHKALDYNPFGRPVFRVDDDTVQHTADLRRKISEKTIEYFSTYQYSTDTVTWDEQISGTGSVDLIQHLGNLKIGVGGNIGDEVVRQTKRVIRYIPGKQNELQMGIRFGNTKPGIRKRVGIFDGIEGFYFEDNGGELSIVLKRLEEDSSISTTKFTQPNWNYDTFDGNGPSGIVFDPAKQQLLIIEYDWFGTGQIEFGFLIGNNKYPIHQFDFANILDRTYTSTAYSPVRTEITNLTGESTSDEMYVGSMSLSTEGKVATPGREENISNEIPGYNITLKDTFYPVLAIRLKLDRLRGVVIPWEFSAATIDNTSIYFRVYRNPVITGGSWISYSGDSVIEYNNTATGFSNGDYLQSGFISAGAMGFPFQIGNQSTNEQIGRTNMGSQSEILMIAIASTTANKTAFASLSWVETK